MKIYSTENGALYGQVGNARFAPWLRQGATPGSYQTKAPPRVARRGHAASPWAPHVSALQVLRPPQ